MERKGLPVYLTAEQYAALHEAAVAYGKPMTDVVRDLIESHLMPGGRLPTDLSDLAGSVSVGHATEVATNKDAMIEEALADLRGHERPLRVPRS
jgi:hypothetical protein